MPARNVFQSSTKHDSCKVPAKLLARGRECADTPRQHIDRACTNGPTYPRNRTLRERADKCVHIRTHSYTFVHIHTHSYTLEGDFWGQKGGECVRMCLNVSECARVFVQKTAAFWHIPTHSPPFFSRKSPLKSSIPGGFSGFPVPKIQRICRKSSENRRKSLRNARFWTILTQFWTIFIIFASNFVYFELFGRVCDQSRVVTGVYII